MIEARDPKTGAKIRWSFGAKSSPGVMPTSAAVPGREGPRRWALVEHPDMAVLFDGHICVGTTKWDGLSRAIYRYDATTHAYVDQPLQLLAYSTAGGTEDRQVTQFHRMPQLAATPAGLNLYCVINSTTQGAGPTWNLRKMATGGSTIVAPANFTMTTAAHWVAASVPQVNSVNLSSGYYYGCRAIATAADAERVFICGMVNAGASNSAAAVMYSDDFDTAAGSAVTTWVFKPIITGDGTVTPVMSHVAAYSTADGSASMLVGVVTNRYGRDWLGIVYSEDGGATWYIAGKDAAQGDVEISGEVAYDNAAFTGRQKWADADAAACVHRVIYDAANQTAWVSFVAADTDDGYGGNCESTAGIYLLKIEMAARATGAGDDSGCRQNLYGPFLASDRRSFDNGMQIISEDANNLLGIVAMPEAPAVTIGGDEDQADGGPTLRIYRIPKVTPGDDEDEDWTLVRTVSLPSGGSPYDYVHTPSEAIRHEWGYGHHQTFNGISVVDGDSDALAVLLGDQRISNVPQCYHMGRIGILEPSTGTVTAVGGTPTGSQIIVPSNADVVPSTGHRGIPCYGVEDWRTALNVGDGALTIVVVLSGAGAVVGAPDRPLIDSEDYFGMPLVNFFEHPGQDIGESTTPQSNAPKNGWGLEWSVTKGLCWWFANGFAGADTTDAGMSTTARILRCNALGASAIAGSWVRACLVKKANAAADTDFFAYANGAATALNHYGDLVTVGSVASHAKLRWFHGANSYSKVVSVCSAAAGIWIYNTAFTTTQAANVTKAPGASGQIDPLDSSIVGNLIARNYSGVRDWQAIQSRSSVSRPVDYRGP